MGEKKKQEIALKKAEKQKVIMARIKEQEEKYKLVLHERMAKWNKFVSDTNDNIYKELQIPDAKCFDIGFNKEIDRYLFILTYYIGYGEWNKIYLKLVNHPYFQFNFLIKTLKPLQLKNRMDSILRACISSKKSKKRTSRESSLEIKMKNININNQTQNENDNEPPNK